MESLAREVEQIRSIVGRHFPVYETKVRGDVVALYVNIDEASLGPGFEALRRELKPLGYIPVVLREAGEHVLLVQRKPPMRFRSARVNLVLLAITAFTTILAGGSLWAGYVGQNPDSADPLGEWRLALAPGNAGYGALVFALPLLLILGTHEMAHYLTAKRHGVAASLPFFLPSLPPLGTFGALISMREPIPNKKALVDIGISGPLAGLAVAIPVSALGLYLTRIFPGAPIINEGGNLTIGIPALWDLLLLRLIPIGGENLHPLAFAGWVGLFVTALNLLPAGQLDGGHVARALLGRNSKWLSYVTIALMVVASVFYLGWAILAMFILFLGPRHPPPLDDLTKLPLDRKLLGVVAVVVMALSFVLVPLQPIAPVQGVQFQVPGVDGPVTQFNVTLAPGEQRILNFTVDNTGNVLQQVNLTLGPNATALAGQNWTLKFVSLAGHPLDQTGVTFTLNQSQEAAVGLLIRAPNVTQGAPPYRVDVVAKGYPEVSEVLLVVVQKP